MNRFRRLITGSIVAITLALSVERAPAQLIVFDPNNYAQNVSAIRACSRTISRSSTPRCRFTTRSIAGAATEPKRRTADYRHFAQNQFITIRSTAMSFAVP